MNFDYTEEQELLRTSLRAYLRDHYSFEQRRQWIATTEGRNSKVWQDFAGQLGILGLAVAEDDGGIGGDAVSCMVVMEELGRNLVVEPYLESSLLGVRILQRSGNSAARALLAGVVDGSEIIVPALNEAASRFDLHKVQGRAQSVTEGFLIDASKIVVRGAPWASRFIVSAILNDELALFLVDANQAGLTINAYPCIDGGRAGDVAIVAATVNSDALLATGSEAETLLAEVQDLASAMLAAESLGVMARMHEDTVEYTRQRRQFGQPIANFQALQHRMVDMYMQLEMARSATLSAVLRQGEEVAERALAASAAKATINEACQFVGQNAVQLHGGMGMTDELAVSHYFKRATAIETQYGSRDYHLLRHADIRRSA